MVGKKGPLLQEAASSLTQPEVEIVADRNTYGAVETNSLGMNGTEYHSQFDRTVLWTEPGLYITRLRLLSDVGLPWWDISYCHGTVDGEPVRVRLPFGNLPKRGMIRRIIEHAIEDGVYAKGMGILDNISTLC